MFPTQHFADPQPIKQWAVVAKFEIRAA